ncbi:hypothetical protein LPB136_07185 [Tenacibaculum todarodis]|uniref:DUF4350 domain-containing protein n=1 Tax=Tenacibaculum todarodis TaxID=1850252 RepID=A0A1L3JJ51_9FLAO|nr:hypothetical protein [Tenacibaculum todarodis]APG65144.1 hypothetical protein LPB136_07185 [Tenacibaculum todarodis]
MKNKIYFFFFMLFALNLKAQQIPDSSYVPNIINKAYPNLNGTTVFIDEAHNNFHTKDNRFLAFSNVLKADGYSVKSFTEKFTVESLSGVKILVISNALEENARGPFVIPTKSAFTKEEVKSVKKWVEKGGSLFLIADHMPFAGAASKLGEAFGFTFYDSFLFDENRRGILDFYKEKKDLGKHKITDSISKIRTFTGQAFKIPNKSVSILNLKKKYNVFLPDTMWVFNDKTKKFNANNLSQGAVLEFGKGKIAVFGEAAMFTAQLAGRNRFKAGMNSEDASENYKLLLNIIHWLDKVK